MQQTGNFGFLYYPLTAAVSLTPASPVVGQRFLVLEAQRQMPRGGEDNLYFTGEGARGRGWGLRLPSRISRGSKRLVWKGCVGGGAPSELCSGCECLIVGVQLR